MSLASLVPDIEVDPALLPALLPWSLRYNVLYPYCELFSHIVSTRTEPPPWTAELEAYWGTFDIATWEYLRSDDLRDRVAISALQGRLRELKSARGGWESPDGAAVAELQDAVQLLTTRRRTRMDRLLGLDKVRTIYLEHPQNRHTGVFDWDFLESKFKDSTFSPPKAAPFSLWPLPLDPSLSYEPHRDDLVCWGQAGVDWSKYALPDRPTLESEAKRRQFEPTAEESLEDANDTVSLEDADDTVESGWLDATMDDPMVPLVISRSDGARSSGFIPAYAGCLHRRRTQRV